MKRAVLVLGFGGPTSPDQVRPFIESVLDGARVPPGRLEAVARNYEAVGGRSPYNELASRQAAALEARLAADGRALPVVVGFRHSTPSFRDAFAKLAADGVEEAAAFVLTPLRSSSSWGKYVDRAEKARVEAGAQSVRVRYAAPFHDDPLFIAALADRVREALSPLAGRRSYVLFTAHSIPENVDRESGYSRQFNEIASLTAARLGLAEWGTAYQSRSGNPSDPWLSPDVRSAVEAVDRARFDSVLVVPAGFLCENVEILYDLDVDARAAAERSGLLYARSAAVQDHPLFVELMARRVTEAA